MKAISSLISFWQLKNVGIHKKSGIPAPQRDARSKNLKFVASFQFLEGTPKISPRAHTIKRATMGPKSLSSRNPIIYF
jgi:hypothetical protein